MPQTKLLCVSMGLLVLNAVVASGSVRLSPTVSGVITLDPRGGGVADPASYHTSITTQLSFFGEPERLGRGFLYFDLTSVTEPVDAATLRFRVDELWSGPAGPAWGGVGFYDVTTTAESSSRDRWEDLGAGERYGGRGLSEDLDVGSVVEAQLSPTAVANISSTAELFGIGVVGSVDHGTGTLRTSEYELVLDTSPAAIPEPQSLIIFTAYTLLGLLMCRRRSKKRFTRQ